MVAPNRQKLAVTFSIAVTEWGAKGNAPPTTLRCERAGMMARSHVVISLAGWIAVAPWLHLPPLNPGYLGLAMIGGLLPDLDHPNSWIGRRTKPISTFAAAILGHRGVTHSALAVLGLVALLLQAYPHRGGVSALAVGYLFHLAADMLTPQGLRLAWPLRKTWAISVCRTGSASEPLIVLILVAGMAAFSLRNGTGWMTMHPPWLLHGSASLPR